MNAVLRGSSSHFFFVFATLVVLSGCFVPRETAQVDGDRACTRCHGDSNRTGTRAERAAPPFDIFGNTGTNFPGVGAHELHLKSATWSAPVACEECHVVPASNDAPGHNDGRATLTFGAIASARMTTAPTYDFATRRCDTACHGGTSGIWTKPRPSNELCGTCHEVGPPSPHPRVGSCAVCHADVIASDGGIINPALHVDGTIQVSDVACFACHGEAPTGAPIGSHRRHLEGGQWTRPVACAECHVVPETIATPTHPNGGRAEVLSSTGWTSASTTCTTGCHPSGSPDWNTPDAGLTCSSCHGAPPSAPHPQVTNCALCHPNATGPMGRQFSDRNLHVNGTVDANQPTACNGCHGTSANAAPPRDTNGESATTLLSVGAHQAHVVGRGLARVVQCNECHVVPATAVATGHLDGVTRVVFGGVALANVAQPTYQQGTCANTACHDISNYTSAPGGGTAVAPVWTRVDGTQSTCTSCHGAPPPLPHVQQSDCESCHRNAGPNRTFVRPDLHVNGRVDFAVP